MPLTRAGQAEIVRSNQKDQFYLNFLRSAVADIVQKTCGAHTWLSWRSELDLLSDAGYFLLTTFAGLQTLGEEYVNIVQVNSTRKEVPSKVKRLFMVFFHVFGWYGLQKFCSILEKKLRMNCWDFVPNHTRNIMLKALPYFQEAFTVTHRFHLALFYLHGTFYHLAQRLLGVHYLQVVSQSPSSSNRHSFHILGWLSLIQITATFTLQIYRLAQDFTHSKGDNSESALLNNTEQRIEDAEFVPNWKRCSLCLEERKQSSCTPCGHLFCWECVHEWCKTKAECPLCREKFSPSRLIYLQNYT